MDSKTILVIKKLILAAALIFAACFVFADVNTAKGVIIGFTIFSANILLLAVIFRILLNNDSSLAKSSAKKVSMIALGLKIPVLVGILYFAIRVAEILQIDFTDAQTG